MFRKAKKLSQRLGLKKENCTNQAIHPVETESIKIEERPKNDLDLLLTLETQARTEAMSQKESFSKESFGKESFTSSRPTTIKFELPVTPPRSRSPTRLTYPRARPYRSLPEDGLVLNKKRKKRTSWRQLFSDDDSDSEPEAYVTLGAYVKLKKRPLPTFGYVKFIGGVDFGKGEWVGVELDHRVGNCDGTVDGITYFKTDHHRGIFCKRNDLEAQ